MGLVVVGVALGGSRGCRGCSLVATVMVGEADGRLDSPGVCEGGGEVEMPRRERELGALFTEKEEEPKERVCKITKMPLPHLFPSQTVRCLMPPVYFVFEF